MRRLAIILLIAIVTVSACKDESLAGDEMASPFDMVVAQDGYGDFTSVQQALDAVKFLQTDWVFILIREGEYKEVIRLEKNKNHIALIGEGEVKLTYDNYASKINPETGNEFGTSGSSSTYLHGDDFYAYNITFENTAGPVGQALAVYIDGDRALFENCRFTGNQDTMYGGRSRQYFIDCYIEGTTDFIFGPATAFFDNCELKTKGGSAITAASTESYTAFGLIFRNCRIKGTGENITTLGRPWRPYASVTFLATQMDASIRPQGWDNWGDPANEATARYAEHANTGPGADPDGRVEWVDILTSQEAEDITPKNVFNKTYSDPPAVNEWDPEEVIVKLHDITGL